MPKAGKINFWILVLIKFWIETSCHQNQDRAKSWKNQFSNISWIEMWLEKSCQQNQDRTKSWKNQYSFGCATISHFEMFVPSIYSSLEQKPEKSILNTFWIKCWIEKSCRQNQERAKRKSIFSYFFNGILSGKRLPPKPRSCQKVKNWIFECFLNWILNRKKLPPKTKIVPKAGKINFWILF